MWALVAIGPSPAHAQCVVALEHARRVVTVDRGDGLAIDIAMRGARAQVTVPLGDAPLEVRVDDTLAFAGTGSASLLSLAAGTYGGALEVPEGGLIRIMRARATAAGLVEVDIPVGGDGVLARLPVPCASIVGSRGEGLTSNHGPNTPEHAARRSQLVLRTDLAGDVPPLHIRALRPWDPITVVEERDRWRRIALPLGGARLSGWVPATALRALRPPPRERAEPLPRAVRCGYALGEREHAIIARGAPVTLPGSERVWTHAESEDSMLVRVRGEHAEILGTSSLRSHTMVRGCPTPNVLGVVSTAFLTRDVVSVLGLRLRSEGSGYLLEAHPGAALLRDDLIVGDVLTAVGGVPFDRFVTAHELARTLAAHGGIALALTVVRGDETIELAPQVDVGYGTWPTVRRSELEWALDD